MLNRAQAVLTWGNRGCKAQSETIVTRSKAVTGNTSALLTTYSPNTNVLQCHVQWSVNTVNSVNVHLGKVLHKECN